MRPAPIILLWRMLDDATVEEIVTALDDAVYVVCLDGKPIGLRRRKLYAHDGTYKYLRSSHANPGWTYRLCEKLNQRFQTDRFTVAKLMPETER